MEKFIEVATKNYLVFSIICGVLILALIGYHVENKSGRDIKIKKKKVNKEEALQDVVGQSGTPIENQQINLQK